MNNQIRTNEDRGSAHLVLITLFAILLIGFLGWLGYGSWQKHKADAGSEDTLGKTSSSGAICTVSMPSRSTSDDLVARVVVNNFTDHKKEFRVSARAEGPRSYEQISVRGSATKVISAADIPAHSSKVFRFSEMSGTTERFTKVVAAVNWGSATTSQYSCSKYYY